MSTKIEDLKTDKDGWSIYETEEQVTDIANKAVGKTFKEIKNNHINKTHEYNGKGAIGQMIEECWFNIENNQRPEPDFPIPGIELKVTGYYNLADGRMKAKERLVFNMIPYDKDANQTFETSSFMKKNEKVELMCYEYHKDKNLFPIDTWTIDYAHLFKFQELPIIDQEIIKKDYQTIIDKINSGKAHEISEGDTMYLAACRKGAGGDEIKNYKKGTIPAKPRAYSFKPSYMNILLNNYLKVNYIEREKLINNVDSIKEKTFEQIIEEKLKPFINLTKKELIEKYDLSDSNKAINSLLISRMLGIKGNINNSDEFIKANIITKTINIKNNGKVVESMSFSSFNPMDFENVNWEDSEFYDDINNKFMFILFKEDEKGISRFNGIKFWTMPKKDIDEAEKVWNKTKEIFTSHTLMISKTKRGNSNNLPSKKDNAVCHVRPHARDANDTYVTPQGILLTKQCFWLNNTYIANIIKD